VTNILESAETTELGTKPAGYYQHVRPEILIRVPPGAKRVLDIGCGTGALGAELLRRGADTVVGLEAVPEAAARAREVLTDVIAGDVEAQAWSFEPGSFDCVVCADVLEHLRDPGALLSRVRPLIAPGGVLIASIPNVRHYSIFMMLAAGRWTYMPEGLMDSTHLRFFTWLEIKDLAAGAGYEIVEAGANIDQAFDSVRSQVEAGKPMSLAFGRIVLKDLTPADVQDLFIFQYLITARPHKSN
jgi:SAM-dependent methyltransferase